MFKLDWEKNFDRFWYENSDTISKLENKLRLDFPNEDNSSDEEHDDFIRLSVAYCIYNDSDFDLDEFMEFLKNNSENDKYANLYNLVEVGLVFNKMVDLEILTKGNNSNYVPTLEYYEQEIKNKKKKT